METSESSAKPPPPTAEFLHENSTPSVTTPTKESVNSEIAEDGSETSSTVTLQQSTPSASTSRVNSEHPSASQTQDTGNLLGDQTTTRLKGLAPSLHSFTLGHHRQDTSSPPLLAYGSLPTSPSQLRKRRVYGSAPPSPRSQRGTGAVSASPRLPRGVVPPVPPETYLWEDIRRQRARGGYPWSHLDKPPLGSKEDVDDHEYEVINPPPPRVDIEPPPSGKKLEEDDDVAPAKKFESETSSLGSGDPNFIHIPLHDDPNGGKDDDASKDLSAQELQARMEERFFAATPETTASRTDCDVNTSQLDSSGLEDLPLRRGSRKKKLDDKEAQARGLQQRIRSQAGRLRAKLRSMKMPDRPKFNMPERPKFNLPDRPKFTMPERPKFNLPERPKFKFPERPKFNMPQRPKISMPSMPSMPSFSRNTGEKAPKKTSSLRRPLRDRATNPSTVSNASSNKKNFFDFDFRTYPRIFDRSKRKGDYATSSPKSTPRSQTPPPSMESTKPRMPFRKKGPVGSRWVHRFTDIKYVDDEDAKAEEAENLRYRRDKDSPDFRIIKLRDSTDEDKIDDEEMQRDKIRYENEVRDAVEELERQRQERDSAHTESESTTAFRDKNYDYAVTMVEATPQKKDESIPESNREERSSGSSSDRHRAGVLEEIDSDEFFLRQKGISQEDVDVGRYLTSEIREAFRPPANSLTQMDDKYFYDNDGEEEEEEEQEDGESLGNQYRGTPEREPIPPTRTRSLKPRKRTNKASPPAEEEELNNFNTFPPARPKRNRRGQQEEEANVSKTEDMSEEHGGSTEAPWFLITEPQEMSYEEEPSNKGQQMEDEWQDMEEKAPPPMVPKRVRRSRQEHVANKSSSMERVPEALRNGHYTHDDWKENVEPNIMKQEVVALRMEPDYIIPGEPESAPVAPKRERRRPSRGTSLHSLAEDSLAFRGSESIPQDERDSNPMTEQENGQQRQDASSEQQLFKVPVQYSQEQELGESGGYATVDKTYPTKPARPNRPKPPRPPAPVRRKKFGHFFSLPRKTTHAPPTRPLRNYSTLGPSRPSRRERSRKSESYTELDDDQSRSANEESHASNREDLQSGDVIERMKGRPLPAPPRPQRKKREANEEGGEDEGSESMVLQPDTNESALGALNDDVFYSKKETIAQAAQDPQENKQPTKEDHVQSPRRESQDERTQSEQSDSTVRQVSELSSGQESIRSPSEQEPPLLQSSERLTESTARVETLQEADMFEEVTVSTQTDPLPDDCCMVIEDEEPHPHADACTETAETEIEPRIPVVEPPVQQVQQVQSVQQAPEPAPPQAPTIIEREVPVYIMPDNETVIQLTAQRLQVADLDIERLNVGELQARKILVSDIDGVTMQVAELCSKSGRLVINGIELPPGFLQEIYDSFPRPEPVAPSVSQPTPSTTQESESIPPRPSAPQAAPTCEPQITSATVQQTSSMPISTGEDEPIPPSIPPPPAHMPMDPIYSYIPSAMRVTRSQLRDLESEEELISYIPSSHRRRRHHVPKPVPRYSTDEEEESVSFHPRRQPNRSEPSVVDLGRQLVQAVTTTSMRAVRSLIQYTSTQLEGEDKRRELQTILCILLVLVAGLILMGFGTGKTFHHHHWDYLNPPQ